MQKGCDKVAEITIFLADDHAVFRDGLQSFLETQPDFRVVGTAGDGREAVRIVKELLPDIVIMDIAMPGLNGIDAAQQIRKAYKSIGMIILSMYGSSEQVCRALRAGARGFLVKESSGEELVEAIRAVHAGQRHLSTKITELVTTHFIRNIQAPPVKSPIEQLNARERQVLQLVVEGKTSSVIAENLLLSVKTVETYRARLMRKLGIENLAGLVKFAIANGLTPIL